MTINSGIYSFLWAYNVIILLRVSMNHTGAMTGVGQETWPFGAFRNVHEVDIAILRCTQEFALRRRKCALFPRCLYTSCLISRTSNILSAETVKHTPQKVQEVAHSTHTFLILPLDAASCLVTMAGTKSSGEGCFFGEGERIVPRFLEQCSRDRREPAGTSDREEQHP